MINGWSLINLAAPGGGSGKEFARVTGWLECHRGCKQSCNKGQIRVFTLGTSSVCYNLSCLCCLGVMKIRRMFLRVCVTTFFFLVIIVAWNGSPRGRVEFVLLTWS